MSKVYPVIMSGGSGTRMWPLSRMAHPKQYHSLVTDSSMFLETLRRVKGVGNIEVADPIVICAASHTDLILDQAEQAGIPLTAILTEPMARNTAAVGAVAARFVRDLDPGSLILLLPADHHVTDVDGFWQAVGYGIVPALDGYLTTLGIKPDRPETGYGYIRTGDVIAENVCKVAQFKEKPDTETARTYLESGDYFWNAGIFLFSAEALENEYQLHAPEILRVAGEALAQAVRAGVRVDLDKEIFATCPSDSIDFAIMEKSLNSAIVAPVEIGWSDVGSWESIVDLKNRLHDGDRLHNGDVLAIDTINTLVHTSGPLVATLGVEDLVIVATKDAVLVARADRSQDIKTIVAELKKSGRHDLL